MPKFIIIIVFLLVHLPVAVQADTDPVPFEAILPADTDMVLMIEDVPRFLQRWSESPLGRAWNDPQIKRFLAPMRREMEIDRWEEVVRDETGMELDDILGIFTGQVVMVIPDFPRLIESEDDGDITMAIMAEVGEDPAILRRLLQIDLESTRKELEENESLEEIEEEFQGEILHIRHKITEDGEKDQEGWAVVNGVAVMAEPKAYLQQLVEALADKSIQAPLKDNPGFRKVRKRVPATDLLFWMNSGAVLPILREALAAEMDNPEAPNPMGITSKAVLDALAVDVLESGFLSTTLKHGATHIDFGIQFAEDRGIVKLLAIDPGPVRPPAFLPDTAVEAGVANFSLPRMWQAMKEIFGAVNPGFLGMLEMQLGQLSSTHGFDLEKGVFGSLGNQVVTAKFLWPVEEPGETPTLGVFDELFGISVTDRQSLEMGLEALKSMAGAGGDLFETTEYLGSTIFTVKQAMPSGPGLPDRRLSYTLTEDYLLVSMGTQAPLRAVLSRRGKNGGTPWDRPEIKKAVATLPPDLPGLSFFDVERTLQIAIENCERLQTLVQDPEAEEESSGFCDPEAKPDPSTISRYFGPGVGAQDKNGGGFYGTLRLMHPSR